MLYDQEALDAAWDLVKDFSMHERNALRDGVPKYGLKLPFRENSVCELAIEALKISAQGLKNRARLNRHGDDETLFLQPLMEIALANETPAERKLALFEGEWQGNIDRVFKQFAY